MANINITVPDGYLATAVVADRPYTVSPKSMTNEALLHVFEYGFQRIVNDKTGGKSKDAVAKDKAASDMIARLVAAEYKRRKIGASAVDPVVKHIRGILRVLLGNAAFAAKSAEYKAFSEAADKEAYLDDWFATMPEALAEKVTTAANQALAREKALRESQAASIAALAGDMAAFASPAELIPAGDRETPAKKASKKSK